MDNAQDDLDQSFDSSIELDDLSLTQTTNSLPQIERVRTASLQDDDFGICQALTPTKSSKEEQKEEFSMNNVFIGFKNGWGKKNIVINQSKLKRAKQFFDDTQVDDNSNPFPVAFSFSKPEPNKFNEWETNQFSMPCFKTVGSGAEVKISQNAKQKVSNLFRQFQSIKKPTKMKKAAKFSTQSMIKTFNVQSKLKQQPTNKDEGKESRKSFNWEEYEREYRNEVERENCNQSKIKKRETQPKRRLNANSFSSNKEYIFVKLFSLVISREKQLKSSDILAKEIQNISTRNYMHNSTSCIIMHCIFCKIKYQPQQLQVRDIYNIFNKQFSKKWIDYQKFLTLYNQICFKLLKYQSYWPDIINKSCHVNNIIIEINKRSLISEKETQPSFLRYCISKDQVGRKVNLIVKDKYINEKMKMVYILLSDGWHSVWAVIEEKNLLYSYVKGSSKLRVGTKLSLSLWNIHPISNILEFCPHADNKDDKCIEFFYNGSIILQPNARLGYSHEQFYRPLDKCRAKGGLIPVTEGTIIRLFTIKNASKRAKNESYSCYSSHFAEILTSQGFTCLIKFVLNEQSSLVEYFRLYHSYRLYKLKINEDNMLTFLMNQSRFQEVKLFKISEKEQIYPQPVIKLLRNRLLNCRDAEDWKEGKYDLLCSNGKTIMKDGHEYRLQIDGENIPNFSAVYQRVQVTKTSQNSLKISKVKDSSQLRKLPKIYEKVTSNN